MLFRSKNAAGLQWAKEFAAITALERLISWCNDRSIGVRFCKAAGAEYDSSTRCIKINCHLLPEKQLYILLHECGHYLIGDKEKHERFGMGYPQHNAGPAIKRTFHHRCDIVDEELEAWHRGWKLGKRLGLRVDKSEFDRLRTSLLKSYFKWALRIDGYGADNLESDAV